MAEGEGSVLSPLDNLGYYDARNCRCPHPGPLPAGEGVSAPASRGRWEMNHLCISSGKEWLSCVFYSFFRLPKHIEGQGVCLAARTRPLWRLFLTPLSHGCFTLEFEIRPADRNERVGHMELLVDTQDPKQVEIGMQIEDSHQGQGLGTRALHLIEPFLESALGVELRYGPGSGGQCPQQAFAEKAGYRTAGHGPGRHDPFYETHWIKRVNCSAGRGMADIQGFRSWVFA